MDKNRQAPERGGALRYPSAGDYSREPDTGNLTDWTSEIASFVCKLKPLLDVITYLDLARISIHFVSWETTHELAAVTAQQRNHTIGTGWPVWVVAVSHPGQRSYHSFLLHRHHWSRQIQIS